MTVNTLNSSVLSFEGYVWKLSADPVQPILVAEVRNTDTRTADYTGISLQTGEVLATVKASSTDSWWTGLLESRDGRFFTHGYRDPKFPGQKGVACYSSLTGKQLWLHDDLSYYGISPKGVILAGSRPLEPLYFLADPETGNLGSQVKFEDVLALRKEVECLEGQLHLTRYPEGSTHFSTVSSFLKGKTGKTPVAAVEYAEREGYFIISYYLQEDGDLSNYILVARQSGEVLFHDQTASKLTGTGFDSFLVIKDWLIYVKDKKDVVILSL